MQQRVRIYKDDKKIKVKFIYNDELVDIMRSFDGWFFRKEKAWIFPATKVSDLREELVKNKYGVDIITLESGSTDLFQDKLVLSTFGICKECNQHNFVGENGYCVRCEIKRRKEK